jgi:hypothetical protein
MHIFKHFKCFIIQLFSKFKNDVPHISIYFSLLYINIFYNIKKCCTMHIFKHFKCFTIQIFSKFK